MNKTGSNNIAIGYNSGKNNNGSNNIFIGPNACLNQISANNLMCMGGANPLIAGNTLTRKILIDATMVITGDLYVSGTIYEGNNDGDNGFDTLDEISGSAVSGNNDEIILASYDSSDRDQSGDNNSNTNDPSDDQGSINDISDSSDSSDNQSTSTKQITSTALDDLEYVDLKQFMNLSDKVNNLSNKIDMLSLGLEETQNLMREGFAMSSALASMPTPTDLGLNFSAGAGNYDGANALAIGFVYVADNYILQIGHSKSDTGSKGMTNIGFTINIDNILWD